MQQIIVLLLVAKVLVLLSAISFVISCFTGSTMFFIGSGAGWLSLIFFVWGIKQDKGRTRILNSLQLK